MKRIISFVVAACAMLSLSHSMSSQENSLYQLEPAVCRAVENPDYKGFTVIGGTQMIYISTTLKDVYEVRVIDLNGRLVAKREGCKGNIGINVSTAGVYIVLIEWGDNVESQKVQVYD